MKRIVLWSALIVSGFSSATSEYAAPTDAPFVPLRPDAVLLPVPPPPAPLTRVNALLRAYGVTDEEAPAPPPGYRVWGAVVARVTAYEPSAVSCGRFADGRTSTLRSAWKMDGCAVDPDAIPYGTLVWVPGAGWRVADDTGTAMKRAWRQGTYHIDIRMPSVSGARRWGVQDMLPVLLCVPE